MTKQQQEKQESNLENDTSPEEEQDTGPPTLPIIELNCDIIGDSFWEEYPYLLNPQIVAQAASDNIKDMKLKAVQNL